MSPECYLIVYNVSKRHNIGTLVRCATAFNVKEVCLVGSREFNTFGSHGSDVFVNYRHYKTLEECCDDLRTSKGCEIIGVEIVESAKPIHTHPFKGPVAFMLGNEGQGLSQRQINACDSFVYISQYGAGTASLNVAVAASIVLHHFALWAGYEERSRSGFKFDVAERPQRVAPRGMVPLSAEEVAALQAQRAAQKAGSEAGDAGVGLDFSEEGLPEFALSTG